MNIEYVSRNFQLDDRVRDYAQSKLRKVVKFLEEPVEVRLLVEQTKHRQIAEFHVAHRFGVLQATEETDQMRDAINLAVDKVEKQARRSRKKFMDKR
ncbi:MAG: ribosome-associated translation inhibitor RaiA, partial [Acidobacteria bacterium]|nr:ribosome-associated translation inhibitor RaiA [Acidobacteriota bacterium]NIT09864.1 ribosome-associated translation inhibitor RaiA [Acidobacteriota bacterium]